MFYTFTLVFIKKIKTFSLKKKILFWSEVSIKENRYKAERPIERKGMPITKIKILGLYGGPLGAFGIGNERVESDFQREKRRRRKAEAEVDEEEDELGLA